MKGKILRIDFTSRIATSEGEPVKGTEKEVAILFNTNIISTEEVNKLINTGMYEYDERVVVMTQRQANFLRGEKNNFT